MRSSGWRSFAQQSKQEDIPKSALHKFIVATKPPPFFKKGNQEIQQVLSLLEAAMGWGSQIAGHFRVRQITMHCLGIRAFELAQEEVLGFELGKF